MVRLKHQDLDSQDPLLDFNSTMVRLKQTAEERMAQEMLFQFHYGSIEAECN